MTDSLIQLLVNSCAAVVVTVFCVLVMLKSWQMCEARLRDTMKAHTEQYKQFADTQCGAYKEAMEHSNEIRKHELEVNEKLNGSLKELTVAIKARNGHGI